MKPADARDRLEERLLSLLYDELPDGEAAALRAELEADPKAAARFAEWQTLRTQLDALPTPEPDPQVHYDILREARKAASPDVAVGGFWGWLERLSFSPAMAGLGLMAAAAGLFAMFNTMDTEQADLAPAAKPTAAASAVKTPPDLRGLPGQAAAPAAGGDALGAERKLAAVARDAEEGEAEPALNAGSVALKRGGGGLKFADSKAEAGPKREKAKTKRLEGKKSKAAVGDLLGSLDTAKDAAPAKRPRRAAKKAAPRKRPAAKRRKTRSSAAADPFGGEAKGGGGPAPQPDARPKPAPKPTRPAQDPPADVPAQTAKPSAPRQYAPPPPAAPAPAEEAPQAAAVQGVAAVDGDAVAEDRFDEQTALGGADAPEAERAPTSPPAAARGEPGMVAAETVAKADDGVAANKALADENDDEARTGDRRARQPQARQPANPLAGARAARSAGRLREAAAAYEDVIRTQRRGPTLQQAWFEAAQTYERLGDRMRAVQLYRLVAAAGGSNAAAARARINALTAPGTGNANRPPVAAPMDVNESARPSSLKE